MVFYYGHFFIFNLCQQTICKKWKILKIILFLRNFEVIGNQIGSTVSIGNMNETIAKLGGGDER